MFIADALLIEKALIALLSATGEAPCVVSGPLVRPYGALKLAIFRGESGQRMAVQARTERRLTVGEDGYRVVADLSAQLDREGILLVENA